MLEIKDIRSANKYRFASYEGSLLMFLTKYIYYIHPERRIPDYLSRSVKGARLL